MTDTWTSVVSGTYETATVAGRTRVSVWWKINPIWWFMNDPEPNPPDWYLPGSSTWKRYLFWYIRNPLTNFNDYVLGVCDVNYSVYGLWPVMSPAWLDVHDGIQRTGFKWSIIQLKLPRPFVSYTGAQQSWLGNRRLLLHFGWQPGGSFAIKFNITADQE